MRLPGLRSIHWKVFVSHLLILILPCSYLIWTARGVVERAWLQSTEEGLIDVATITAGVYAKAVETGTANPAFIRFGLNSVIEGLRAGKPLKSRIFGSERTAFDLELILCDDKGQIVYDTLGRTGKLHTNDVVQARLGNYGARWEHIDGTVKLYSTVPVRVGDRIVGTVTAVKPTKRIAVFILTTLLKFAIPVMLAFSLAAILAYVISGYITRIVRQLASQAESIAAGHPNIKLETWTRSELGMLARALEKMRLKLEGKAYVEDMVTNLSHELKTPLAAIRGAAEILEDSEQPEVRQRFLTNIQHEVARLDQIVGNVLALSRVESQRSTNMAIDIAAITRTLAQSHAVRATALQCDFHADVAVGEICLTIATQQWQLLCNNLLDNALRFSRPGGAVSLRLSLENDIIVLEVSDQGVGIEPDLLPKIFDRFFTTPAPATGERGTGLGLAIVRSIVESHQGTITVQPNSPAGTVFRVKFH